MAPRRTAAAAAPPAARIAAIAGAVVLVGSVVLSAFRVEPFHTWLYPLVWYPFLALVGWVIAERRPERAPVGPRLRVLAPLFAWSVPVWMLFEIANFRLGDWYYVGVPDALLSRWTGIVLSFATVLPGLFLVAEALDARGILARARTPEFPLGPRALRRLEIAAAAIGLGALAFPTVLFPLVWIVPFLAIEPSLVRAGGPSLLRELAGGNGGRTVRLLLAGLVCGLVWESMNFVAGGRWIYSVPGLEHLKIFEMPPLGFLGFPPFALACASLAEGLVRLGVLPRWDAADAPPAAEAEAEAAEVAAVAAGPGAEAAAATPSALPADLPDDDLDALAQALAMAESDAGTEVAMPAPGPAPAPEPAPAPAPPRRAALSAGPWRLAAMGGGALLTLLALVGMDRLTVDSMTPRPADVPGIPDGVAAYARPRGGDDVRGLLDLIERGALYIPGESSVEVVAELERTCRLVLLRGIGTANARRLAQVGVRSIGQLASCERDELVRALDALDEPGWHPRPRRVAVWLAAARRAVGDGRPD